MKNGCILNGGVGSGKSRTGLYYYFSQNGGSIEGDGYIPMTNPKDLYIITTARKRDTLEWEKELVPYVLSPGQENSDISIYSNKVVIDSWNNIKKYEKVKDAFFIFDEQRVIGYGAWTQSFLKIAKSNDWIMLSATPGDTWMDYIPVFIANGFYKNKTNFTSRHVIFTRYGGFPKVDRYLETGRLIRLRNEILVNMDFDRKTVHHKSDIYLEYDREKYKRVMRDRWDIYNNEPINNAANLCYILRKVVNSDPSKSAKVLELAHEHKRVIVFYNYDYELDILRDIPFGENYEVAEWNGHKHQPLPEGEHWVYLCQLQASCEGWNCITTDTVIFYSQNYSYKVMTQACGRIDRLNTPYTDLYYYYLKTHSTIDLAIARALNSKKNFNESGFCKQKKS